MRYAHTRENHPSRRAPFELPDGGPVRRVLLLLSALLALSACVPVNSSAGRSALRVLMLGNSLTYLQGLPNMLRELSTLANESRPLDLTVVATGEYTLEKHWNDPKSLAAIRTGGWDVVVLQEFSARPVLEPALFREYAKRLHAEIEQVKAKPVLYLTWARADLVAQGRSQADWTAAYLGLADELRAAVSPAGIAWENTKAIQPNLTLLQSDGIHAEPLGAYISACAMYATLYGRSPEGLRGPSAFPNMPADAVRLAQSAAWRAVTALEPKYRFENLVYR